MIYCEKEHIQSLLKEVQMLKAEIERERDGILYLRKKYGAKDDEIFSAFIERICKERDEFYAKAASLVFHLPEETRCGDIQEWYDDFLRGHKMLANSAMFWKEQAEKLAGALKPFLVHDPVSATKITSKKVYDDFKNYLDMSSNNL